MFTLIDESLFHVINVSVHNAFFNSFMPVFSQVWIMWLGSLIGIVAYAVHCWRSSLEPVGRILMLVMLVGLSVGVTDVTTSMLKHSISRERPCQVEMGSNYYSAETQQWTVVGRQTAEQTDVLGGSMPSSPAAACMAVAVVLSLLFYRSNPWVYLLPLSVGLSQIYVGKNYPFDVIVGWIIGVVSVIAVWWICHLIIIRFSSHRRLQ